MAGVAAPVGWAIDAGFVVVAADGRFLLGEPIADPGPVATPAA